MGKQNTSPVFMALFSEPLTLRKTQEVLSVGASASHAAQQIEFYSEGRKTNLFSVFAKGGYGMFSAPAHFLCRLVGEDVLTRGLISQGTTQGASIRSQVYLGGWCL